jgi:deoxyinosine 3'endonuclease (endonuclease V)
LLTVFQLGCCSYKEREFFVAEFCWWLLECKIDMEEQQSGLLAGKLEDWKKEQLSIASQVIRIEDSNDDDTQFKVLPRSAVGALYGGVDVSFPENESDPAVATYVILQPNGKVVYRDYLYFDLTVPYISSYLSFREIEPLEGLVKKQMEQKPELTPCAILVDGNGILHVRRAGIACFLGVRTDIPTIGIGKKLYCEDGLEKEAVRRGIDNTLLELEIQLQSQTNLSDQRPVLICKLDFNSTEAQTNVDVVREEILKCVSISCTGIGIKLMGASGEVLGCALLGHGGTIWAKERFKSGTKNPIYISIGHNISLDEAVAICAELSQARIPEPVRQADLWGRELLRQHKQSPV